MMTSALGPPTGPVHPAREPGPRSARLKTSESGQIHAVLQAPCLPEHVLREFLALLRPNGSVTRLPLASGDAYRLHDVGNPSLRRRAELWALSDRRGVDLALVPGTADVREAASAVDAEPALALGTALAAMLGRWQATAVDRRPRGDPERTVRMYFTSRGRIVAEAAQAHQASGLPAPLPRHCGPDALGNLFLWRPGESLADSGGLPRLSAPGTAAFLRREDAPALALMNEHAAFGGATGRRYGGTFNLDSCVALFFHGRLSTRSHVLHLPVTADLKQLGRRATEIVAAMPGEPVDIALGGGLHPRFIATVENSLQPLVDQPRVSLARLPPHPEQGLGPYIDTLAAYILDAQSGAYLAMDNGTADRLAHDGDIPLAVGPNAAARQSFHSASRFLNWPDRTAIAEGFDGSRFVQADLPALLTAQGRLLYAVLDTIPDPCYRPEAPTSPWQEQARERLGAVYQLLEQAGVAQQALNQLEWHYTELR
jgi:hypothetical protein